MIDIKRLRTDFDATAKKLEIRGVKSELLEEFVILDKERRSLIVETEELKSYRNEVSGAIATLKRSKENADEKIK